MAKCQICFADPSCRVFHPPTAFHMDLFTVMGPGGRETPRDLMQPPKFDDQSDKYQWRNDVRLWVRLVRKLAKGGDMKALALSKALAEALYLSVNAASKHKLDYQINAGFLKMDDATTDEEQDDAIACIVNLLAKISPHESVKRISKMMRNIYTCRRQNSESPHDYAKRFECLVSQYLNHCHKTSSDQDNQVFVMVLLENSALPQSVQDNLILHLTTCAQNTSDLDAPSKISIPRDTFASIQEQVKNIESNATLNNPGNIERYVSQLNSILTSIDESTKRIASTDRVQNYIRLEDAIAAISQIEHEVTPVAEKKSITVPDTQPPRNALMSTPRSPPTFRNQQDQHNWKRRRYNGPPRDKKNTRCHACGDLGHWKGDMECRFFDATKQDPSRRNQPNQRENKPFFH